MLIIIIEQLIGLFVGVFSVASEVTPFDNVWVICQRHRCPKLSAHLSWTGKSGQDWRLWNGSRHLQVRRYSMRFDLFFCQVMHFSPILTDSISLFPEPAITGKAVAPCCRSSGCHLRLSWRESLLARLTPGTSETLISTLVITTTANAVSNNNSGCSSQNGAAPYKIKQHLYLGHRARVLQS